MIGNFLTCRTTVDVWQLDSHKEWAYQPQQLGIPAASSIDLWPTEFAQFFHETIWLPGDEASLEKAYQSLPSCKKPLGSLLGYFVNSQIVDCLDRLFPDPKDEIWLEKPEGERKSLDVAVTWNKDLHAVFETDNLREGHDQTSRKAFDRIPNLILDRAPGTRKRLYLCLNYATKLKKLDQAENIVAGFTTRMESYLQAHSSDIQAMVLSLRLEGEQRNGPLCRDDRPRVKGEKTLLLPQWLGQHSSSKH